MLLWLSSNNDLPSLPPTTCQVHAGRSTPLHTLHADDEGPGVLPFAPISEHNVRSAGNKRQSLSSCPADRKLLACFHSTDPARHAQFAPLPSNKWRSLLILLRSDPLQRERIPECFLVTDIQIRQLLHFFGRSR